MIDRETTVTEGELHAYVDGELAADRRAAVEAWLAAHPDDAARVASWTAQGDAVRARYGAVAAEPVPARFNLDRLARRGSGKWRAIAAVAVVLAFVGGSAAGWFGRAAWDNAALPAKAVITDAIDAHRLYIAEVRHPIEVPADASHLIPWLSRRVGSSIRAPDLASFGLKLLGGRLLPTPSGPAALFMYEGSSGDRFTLYCARSAVPQTALHYNAAGPVAAFYWTDGEMAFVVSGPADRERLLGVAESSYKQLEGRARTSLLRR